MGFGSVLDDPAQTRFSLREKSDGNAPRSLHLCMKQKRPRPNSAKMNFVEKNEQQRTSARRIPRSRKFYRRKVSRWTKGTRRSSGENRQNYSTRAFALPPTSSIPPLRCADRKKAAFSTPPMLGVLKIRPRRGYVTLSGNTHVGYGSKWFLMRETIYPIPRRDRLVA